MKTCIFTVLLLFSLVAFAAADAAFDLCIHNCDVSKPGGDLVTFCANDGNTYTATRDAISMNGLNSDCYSVCGIQAKYLGPCGCPNNCYNDTGNGVCNNGACTCVKGFRGADCSAPKCPDHNCSGHGKCKAQSSSNGNDYCICDNGYTGYDCSVAVPTILKTSYGTLPYGEANTSTPYYANDKYGDKHPVFNNSLVATIKITMSASSFDYTINPNIRSEQEYQQCKMFFYNGIESTNRDAKIRIKGFSSRSLTKKSWNVQFADDWKDLSGFGLKAIVYDKATSEPLVLELFRAMNAPTYRSSLATLFINDFYYGVVLMVERLDENFVKSRFNNKDANIYKIAGQYHFQYLGSVPAPYQNLITNAFDNIPANIIEQYRGDGDWNDFVILATVLNATNMAVPFLQQQFNQLGFIRASAAAMAVDDFDCYIGTGNNWMVVNAGNSSHPNWQFIFYDFDTTMKSPYSIASFFGMTPAQLEALVLSGVEGLYGRPFYNMMLNPNPYKNNVVPGRPLLAGIYAQNGMNETFTSIYTDLWQRFIFRNPGTVQARRQAYYDMIRPFVYRDRMYLFPGLYDPKPTYAVNFELNFNTTTPSYMNAKFGSMATQFVAKNNGVCNALGQCTCNPNYSGPTCQIYTP